MIWPPHLSFGFIFTPNYLGISRNHHTCAHVSEPLLLRFPWPGKFIPQIFLHLLPLFTQLSASH